MGIQVMGFSILGSASYVELGGAKADEAVFLRQDIKDIAAKYSKTPAQVILRWGVQQGINIIPKSSKKERLSENISVFDFSLTADEMKQISALNTGKRFNDPGDFCEGAFGTYNPIYD